MISYGKQFITAEDVNAVVGVLNSDFLTQGPEVRRFEDALCSYTGARYCITVANGTAALHLAIAALQLEPGTEGLTSPNTFVATANAMIYNRITPVFADIDSDTYNISPREIRKKLTAKTALLLPVHFAGRPAPMKEIGAIAKKNHLRVIEDAAHAIGSHYPDGGKVGNCHYSDMTIFSFHPVKSITTGEGGAIMTNNKELYDNLIMLRSHGITKNPLMLEQNPGPWYYEMHNLGFNYRMTDFQAALGISQLKKLNSFKARRLEIVEKYNKAFESIDSIRIQSQADQENCCFHLYVPQINFNKIGKSRMLVMEKLKNKGILSQVHYIPVHIQPYYRNHFGYGYGDCPKAEAYYEHALSLPLYPAMTDDDIQQVIKSIKEIF